MRARIPCFVRSLVGAIPRISFPIVLLPLLGCAGSYAETRIKYVTAFRPLNPTLVYISPGANKEHILSQATIDAMREMDLSIDPDHNPHYELSEPLSPKTYYITTWGPLPAEIARKYNANARLPLQLKLRKGHYRVRFRFLYRIDDEAQVLSFGIYSFLQFSLRPGGWKEYRRPYRSWFFADWLTRNIMSALQSRPDYP